jgi:hypothetical protein
MICVALQRIENIFVAALEGPVAVVERLMDSATTHEGSPYVDGINCVCVCGGWKVKKKGKRNPPTYGFYHLHSSMYRHFRQWVGTACNNNPFYMQPKLDIVRLVLTFPFI